MRTRRNWGIATVLVVTLFLSAAGLFQLAGGLPGIANRLHLALPGDAGMPYRISYNGRLYSNSTTCAGADWCVRAYPQGPYCLSREMLSHQTPPGDHVGDVLTVVGAPHPIFLPAGVADGFTPALLIVRRDDACWLIYTLDGAP